MRFAAIAALLALTALPAMADVNPCELEASEVQRFATLHMVYPEKTKLTIVLNELSEHGGADVLGDDARELGMVKVADFAFTWLAKHPNADATGPDEAAKEYIAACNVTGPWVLKK